MAAEKKKIYGNMRIIAIEGKDLFRTESFTALKDGKLNLDRFCGILDESLDTEKLCEVYKAHEAEIGYPYLAEKKYCRAIVNISFDLAVKQYEQYGRRFVRYGYTVLDTDMQDHVCVREFDGKPMLIAIEIPYENDKSYAPVENPLSANLLGKYFEYDAEKKEYKRSKKDIPSAVKCEEIREHLYTHGFNIDGIHYVRYKRSAGSSRAGQCLFIAEPLYADMMEWSACGLCADSVSDQASWQAYIALTLSSIESTIMLPKKAILIIPDKVSKFKTNAVCVKEDKELGLSATEEETEIENVIWDGEALLDVSEFEKAGYADKGMMLLRNRFFKTCAFNTNLQKWFEDKNITEIRQLAGYTTARKVEDIKLVITESSLKYLKFMPKNMNLGDALNCWLDNLYEGKTNSAFGVVKTDKYPSLMHGNMAYTNYQLINTLGIGDAGLAELLKKSFEYLKRIQTDPMYLRYHISNNSFDNLDNDNLLLENYRKQVTLDMLNRTPLFANTDFYKNLRSDIVKQFKEKLKRGRIAVEGNYETIFGNPYEFLCAVIDKSYEPTEPLLLSGEQVYTTRFETGITLACVRSPHITMGNLFLGDNTECDEIDRYFNLTENIICINAIGNNIQQRLNGCDYDSDSMLVTSNPWIVRASMGGYDVFGVPVCCVAPSGKADYENTPEGLAKLDRVIANNKIGEIVNLSQFLNSLIWHDFLCGSTVENVKKIYCDVCKLAVLSGMEIDKAKRMYSVDTNKVIRIVKKRKEKFKEENGGQVPQFFKYITEDEKDNTVKLDAVINSPLSFLYDIISSYSERSTYTERIPLSEMFELDENDKGDNDTHKKQNIIEAVQSAQKKILSLKMQMQNDRFAEREIYCEKQEAVFAECLSTVSKNIVNDHILSMLLRELDKKPSEKSKYALRGCRSLLFACMLYGGERRLLSKVKTVEGYYPEDLVYYIEDPDTTEFYDIDYIYGYPHVKVAWDAGPYDD